MREMSIARFLMYEHAQRSGTVIDMQMPQDSEGTPQEFWSSNEAGKEPAYNYFTMPLDGIQKFFAVVSDLEVGVWRLQRWRRILPVPIPPHFPNFCLSACLPVSPLPPSLPLLCQSVCLPVRLSVCLSVCLSFCLSVFLSVSIRTGCIRTVFAATRRGTAFR